jgi:glutamate--cysteine ligase
LSSRKLHRLAELLDKGHHKLLTLGLKGIEKESLRINQKGFIAQTSHPKSLGAALTHPHITTDYSEALLELITPPFADIKDTLQFLHNIHQFVADNLEDELLLAASMPCGINGDNSIPIAEYGRSNIGQMKHIYRQGLAWRYGRTMQSIAGVHFNYSVSEALWPELMALENKSGNLQDYISKSYFGLIRNFLHQGWLILYLFGASPAICKSFFKSRPHLIEHFEEFDQYTLFHPYATSLRMSDIGYKSKNQASLEIDYNSLPGYVESLGKAITTPYPDYEKIGVEVDGEYRQLNSNILQIENEFYSIIRPKQIAKSCEKPTHALRERGVRYIEVRSLDLDLFNPIGIDESRSHFLEAFLLTCLFQDSPLIQAEQRKYNDENQLAVANQGRKPNLMLQKGDQKISLQDWANEILEAMQPICTALDHGNELKPYSQSLAEQKKLVANANLTPSARILTNMEKQQQPFAPYALEISGQHQQFFKNQNLSPELTAELNKLAEQSFITQKNIEAFDYNSFPDFLKSYFSQEHNLDC